MLAALALGFAQQPAQAAGRMYVAKSKHYEVKSDVNQRMATLINQHMEAIYNEYMRRFEDYELKVHDAFNVIVFAKREDYDATVPPPLSGSTGTFVSRMKLLAAWKGERSDEDVFRTLYHEGFHQFLYSASRAPVPIWVNEGFAEYFSEATWNGRGFSTGRVPYKRLFVLQEALKKDEHIPLAQLFGMANEEWLGVVGVDQSRANIQYCEVWSVVHFLIHAQNGRYRSRILTYLKALSEGRDQENAFRKSFGSDTKSFERAWKSYVFKLKPSADEVCRKNLEIILFLSINYYQDPSRFTDLDEFAKEVMDTRKMTWEVSTGDGEKISSQDRDRVKSLFRCPYDKRRKGPSYVLIRDPKTQLPMVFCGHHPGIVYKAFCVPRKEGGYRVYVEQVVRETLRPDLVKALKAQTK